MFKLPCSSEFIWDNILCLGTLLEWADSLNLREALPYIHTQGSSHLQKARTIWGSHFNMYCIQHYPFLGAPVLHAGLYLKLPDLLIAMTAIQKEKSVKWDFIKFRCLPACWLIEKINIRNLETVLKMFYVLTLPSIRYVKEAILPLRNFCLCLLSWQELTLFPAFACHSPGNVTKRFSEVHFPPIPSCYFPPK